MPGHGRALGVNGARLWLMEEGDGPALLLLNGGPGCDDYLQPVADLLSGAARVLRVEVRGCGRASRPGPYDLATTLADLEAVRAKLGVERWVVGGHSWGADLALAYALHHPGRALGLLHLCGTGVQNDRDWSAAYHRGNDAGLDQTPEPPPPYNPQVNEEALASWRRFIKTPDLLRRLAGLPVPALVLGGETDIRPDWPLRQLAALLPHARFVSLAGAAHVPWLTHADALRAHLLDFLNALLERAH